MTTPEAERLYLVEHIREMSGKGYAVFNPLGKPITELPAIYGFNNGGRPGWFYAVLIAEDGTCLGSHLCSDEGYMTHDLGILEGTRPDRHEDFKKHYPDGYRMEFVSHSDFENHLGLQKAFAENEKQDDTAKETDNAR